MRLTRFNNLTKEYEYHLNNPNTSMVQDEIVGTQKLGQLEDIEEELGIDLVTLIKALKDGVYSSFVDSSNKRIILKSNKVLLLETLVGLDCFFEDNDERVLLFSDYGKTWALTKEELEK